MYIDMVLMGLGGWMMLQGMENALLVFGVGAILHFGSGGFATGF